MMLSTTESSAKRRNPVTNSTIRTIEEAIDDLEVRQLSLDNPKDRRALKDHLVLAMMEAERAR